MAPSDNDAGSEMLVMGYRVKVQYQTVSDTEKTKKREAIAQLIVQALRRNRGIA